MSEVGGWNELTGHIRREQAPWNFLFWSSTQGRGRLGQFYLSHVVEIGFRCFKHSLRHHNTHQQHLVVLLNLPLPFISGRRDEIRNLSSNKSQRVVFMFVFRKFIKTYTDLIAGTMLTHAASFFSTMPLRDTKNESAAHEYAWKYWQEILHLSCRVIKNWS